MIKSINKIKNVGCFYDSDFSNIELDRVSIIYGGNGSGKSTLADIFRTIGSNNSKLLQERKSIKTGINDNHQNIELTYLDTNHHLKNFIFSDTNYNHNFPYNIEVFDSQFINDNVFAGLEIQRDNKVNLTKLILGEASVILGKEIAELERQRKQANSDVKNIETKLKNNVKDYFGNFIHLPLVDDLSELEKEISVKTDKLEKLKNSHNQLLFIKNLEIPIEIELDFFENITDYFDKINNRLKPLELFNSDFLTNFNNHIEMNFSVKNGKKKDWIYDGCKHINLFESTSYTDINCPFCGQGLNNAINVIDSYKLYFNDKFRHYFDELTKEKSNLKGFVYTILNNIQLFFKQVSTNSLLTSNYSEFISENYQLIRKKTEILSAGLIENLNNLITMINRGAEDFLMTIEQLQQNPFNSVEHPNSQLTLNDSITIIIETVNDYNFCINEINSLIRQLKQKYNAGNFEDILDDEKEALAKLNRLKDRYIYNNDIIQLKSNYEAAEDLKKEITDKEKELFRQHNVFVNTYFHKVNELFQKFDPRKLLTIEEYQDTKGYQPIYGFKLSFLSKQINDKNINKVLSDGDRRALAFSIFLTKIITDKSYENKILIIDDPITSLDDDRTFILEKFVNRLIENNICQIIVLTHISAFVTKLNEFICNSNNINLMKEKEKPGVFKLTWFSTGSSLEKIENANTL